MQKSARLCCFSRTQYGDKNRTQHGAAPLCFPHVYCQLVVIDPSRRCMPDCRFVGSYIGGPTHFRWAAAAVPHIPCCCAMSSSGVDRQKASWHTESRRSLLMVLHDSRSPNLISCRYVGFVQLRSAWQHMPIHLGGCLQLAFRQLDDCPPTFAAAERFLLPCRCKQVFSSVPALMRTDVLSIPAAGSNMKFCGFLSACKAGESALLQCRCRC